MRYPLLTLVIAGLTVAETYPGEPACAAPCLDSAIAAAGCSSDDTACLCGSARNDIQKDVTPCLLSSCPQSDVFSAASAGLALCSSFEAAKTAAPADNGSGGNDAQETSAPMVQPTDEGQDTTAPAAEPIAEEGGGAGSGETAPTGQSGASATTSAPVESGSGAAVGAGSGSVPLGANGTLPLQVSGVDAGKSILSAVAGLVAFFVAAMAAL